ncbi:MAG TPA: PIG-L family deacetylase [Bacteriovoracaceae bacterium]|nr:PIG-L family deacetylase [Bacteriovoracaceae bacterium]
MDFTPILNSLASLFQPSALIPKKKFPFNVMILSPHPDDESIIGSLALRLSHENGAHIINVAVTLGSKKERQAERSKELSEACKLLNMELVELDDNWKKKEKELKALILKYQPTIIFAPHLKDHHPTHIKTGDLLKKTLKTMKGTTVLVAWTEFWGQMKKPNLMVEVPVEILELQMNALEKHQGEISRNPYHLRLPAWMMDNVRRGSEIIAGNGTESPRIAFAVLYQLQLFGRGKFTDPKINSFLGVKSNIGQIFKLTLEAASGSITKVK